MSSPVRRQNPTHARNLNYSLGGGVEIEETWTSGTLRPLYLEVNKNSNQPKRELEVSIVYVNLLHRKHDAHRVRAAIR